MRPDLSNSLMHFTKGASDEDAYQTLKQILATKCILAGTGCVRGSQRCVCFSETPLSVLKHGLVNSRGFSRYSKFGVLFRKDDVFASGGRPVIYQPEPEYSLLPEALRWRHVRLDLSSNPPIDFTWEREWRLPVDRFVFAPDRVTVILPDSGFLKRLDNELRDESFFNAWAYTEVLGEVAWLYDTGNPWRMEALKISNEAL
jgi:hypothetical protein